MTRSTLRVAVVAALALGLSACEAGYGGGYGGVGIGYAGGYNPAYDRYYGDVGGYRSVPYGYAGSNFGWSGRHYYPGTGNFVYDRGGRQRQWSSREQRYWQNRANNQGGRRGDHRDDRRRG